MDKLLFNFRTPIISFCCGVLFSTICIWVYVTYCGKYSSKTEFEIYQTTVDAVDSRRIYIAGAVKKEGSFEIREEENILDFIQQNIGFSENVDIEEFKTIVNQLSSEENIIFVPSLCISTSNDNTQITNNEVQQESNLISINAASKSELENLPGIGSVYAERIIQGRPYKQLSDLKKIKGIGDKTFSKLEPYICL